MLLGEITTHCPTIPSLRKAPRGDVDDKASSNTCSSWALGQQRQQEGSAAPALGSANTPSSYHPHPRAGAGVPPGHPRDAHQDFPLLKHVWTSRVMGTSPSQRCHAAAQLDCAPCSSVGFDKKTQPDPGEGVLEWRHITQTHMLAMNMPMSMHSHGAKILMNRADTSFLSKEFFSCNNKNDGAGKTTLSGLR